MPYGYTVAHSRRSRSTPDNTTCRLRYMPGAAQPASGKALASHWTGEYHLLVHVNHAASGNGNNRARPMLRAADWAPCRGGMLDISYCRGIGMETVQHLVASSTSLISTDR